MIGPRAEIGAGTVINAGAVIGPGVRIGRECAIGPHVSITHALIGDRVIIHPGTRIGQDGFGYIMGAKGHSKVPQIGRVIIQDDIEIGANTTIDRGAIRDTVIGEGTKIDNLVQIGHKTFRSAAIAWWLSRTGISGSVTVGDYAMLGGGRGRQGPRRRSARAPDRRGAGVYNNVPAGARWAASAPSRSANGAEMRPCSGSPSWSGRDRNSEE